MKNEMVRYEAIESKIYIVRGQKVMLDSDLARLYGVLTKVFNQAVKRNIERFPEDFMFRLTAQENENLRSQIVTSRHGGTRYFPYVFTEHGIAMLSSVLNSKRAIFMNIQIMRVFTRFRQLLLNNSEISKKIELLEKRVLKHDSDIRELVRDIRRLTLQPNKTKKIGFLTEK
jgi:hypothetical protein